MGDYYKGIDNLSSGELAAHCRKHQLPLYMPDGLADTVFRMAWEQGHASGNQEVANYYIDYAQLATQAWKAAREQQ